MISEVQQTSLAVWLNCHNSEENSYGNEFISLHSVISTDIRRLLLNDVCVIDTLSCFTKLSNTVELSYNIMK